MQFTQIGNRLTCSTDAELMSVSVDTWRSDFEFSLFKFVFQTPMRLHQTNDFFRDFGQFGIENGMQLTQIGNQRTGRTDAELMPFAVDTWSSDFVF